MSEREYILPSSNAEIDRLERQARLFGGLEPFRPFLAEQPGAVLDVGCGTGVFTRAVAEQLPASTVVGVDLDEERLEYARAHCDAASFELGSLEELPFADHRFDLVFCRFVLGHATNAGAALAEMARVTRPGGRVATFEMVHNAIHFSPRRPALSALLDRVIAVMRKRDMEPDQGLHTGPAMVRAGFTDVEAQPLTYSALGTEPLFEEYRQNWLDTLEGMKDSLGSEVGIDIIEAALAELQPTVNEQYLVELAILAHGRVPA